MPVTEAQKRATAKYEKENYDKVLTRFPKGTKERILNTGADSINAFIIQAVNADLDRIENHNKSKVYLSGAESKEADDIFCQRMLENYENDPDPEKDKTY